MNRHHAWIAALFAAATAAASHAQPSNDVIQPFRNVFASGKFEVEITPGASYDVSIEGAVKYAERVNVSVADGTLRVVQNGRIWFILFGDRALRPVDVVVTITSPELHQLKFERSVDARLRDFNLDNVVLSASTGSDVVAEGACRSLKVRSYTSADIDASGLVCDEVDVEAHTGSLASVRALERVTGKNGTGGDINIFGEPNTLDVEATLTGGSVRRVGG